MYVSQTLAIRPILTFPSSGKGAVHPGSSAWCSVMTQSGAGDGDRREVPEGWDICTQMADSLLRAVEANTTL